MVTVLSVNEHHGKPKRCGPFSVESDSACGRSDRAECPYLANRLEQHQDQSCSGLKNRCLFVWAFGATARNANYAEEIGADVRSRSHGLNHPSPTDLCHQLVAMIRAPAAAAASSNTAA